MSPARSIVLIFEVRIEFFDESVRIDRSFSGTDISFTQENLYRVTRALFPPNLSVLKQICWRGYIDGLKFLQTRSTQIILSFSPTDHFLSLFQT